MDRHRRSKFDRLAREHPSHSLPCRVRSCGGLLFNEVALADRARVGGPVTAIGNRQLQRLSAIGLPTMWKHDRERRTASFHALDVDPSSMRFNNRVDDGQP